MADGDQSSQPLLDALRADENEIPPDSSRQRNLLPHSESGIVSAVLALLASFADIFAFVVFPYWIGKDFKGEMLRDPNKLFIVVIVVCAIVICTLLGVYLGLVGLIAPGRKKDFAIVGLCWNGLLLLGTVFLLYLGNRTGVQGP
jgi:hypothetical protein